MHSDFSTGITCDSHDYLLVVGELLVARCFAPGAGCRFVLQCLSTERDKQHQRGSHLHSTFRLHAGARCDTFVADLGKLGLPGGGSKKCIEHAVKQQMSPNTVV